MISYLDKVPGAYCWHCLLLAVVAVRVGTATVAIVDPAGGRHPYGLHSHKNTCVCVICSLVVLCARARPPPYSEGHVRVHRMGAGQKHARTQWTLHRCKSREGGKNVLRRSRGRRIGRRTGPDRMPQRRRSPSPGALRARDGPGRTARGACG